ncbi:hypothetical protein [Oceanirhabdus sp. W0125-5]|uniref:hypothetical protein n=1 Tax=Oceanirhabdus sp. W0125-5 TaxID=2999116 RepID=UPI0022F34145|nr:hypothetical protein [Oceanirhabdus sp. W0125-5]WBW99500.1 hypothetical protein OW730_12355 [Oceanirhabdus sp. W0125-5]
MKKQDAHIKRSFVAPAGNFFSIVYLLILIIACVLFVWVPGQPFDFAYAMPIIVGLVVVMGIGEVIIVSCQKKYGKQQEINQ